MADDAEQAKSFVDTPNGPPVVLTSDGDLCCPHCTSPCIYLGEAKAGADGNDDLLRVRFQCEACTQEMDLWFVWHKGFTSMKWRTVAWGK